MGSWLTTFWLALGYFTRLPIPASVAWSAEAQRAASRHLPLVGWVVAAGGICAYALAAWALPVGLAAVVSMAATVRLTGALHEDGWADTCDGLGGGWDKTQALAIMKDPRMGSYGAIGLVLLLLAKALALMTLAPQGIEHLAAALLAGHALSRLAPLAVMQTLPYVREGDSSRAQSATGALPPAALAWAAAWGLAPLALLAWPSALGAFAGATLTTLYLHQLFRRRLGGYTGDCLGAAQQLAELAIYLGLIASWNSI
ncbi:MAG: adenosylcobinamide-GDP ribazoletransferase [Zoogloeaceae bacterium]|nr:adenosylcobinamide-GDP ribazoletransferase [Zoogloeaceae bacterium]